MCSLTVYCIAKGNVYTSSVEDSYQGYAYSF